MSEPINGDELLAQIKPTLRVVRVQVCLRADLLDEWERLHEELVQEQTAGGTKRLAETATKAARAKARQVKRIEDAIEAASPWFVFQALPAYEFQAICAQHPPRDKDQFDLFSGFNREAVTDALVRESLIDPVFSDEGWEQFRKTCRTSEWTALREGAQDANGGVVAPPKSQLVSRILSRGASASA